MFFNTKRSFYIRVLNVVFFFVPSFIFSLVVNNMQMHVGYQMDGTTMVWYKAAGYFYSDFTLYIDFENETTSTHVIRNSDCFYTMMFLVQIVIYSLFIFIFDVFLESNQGISRNPFKLVRNHIQKLVKKSSAKTTNSTILLKKNGIQITFHCSFITIRNFENVKCQQIVSSEPFFTQKNKSIVRCFFHTQKARNFFLAWRKRRGQDHSYFASHRTS